MLKNQRAYQYLSYKTNLKILSLILAFVAKMLGCILATLLRFFKKQVLTIEDEDVLLEKANKIFEKPLCDDKATPLSNLDNDVMVSVIIPAYNVEKYIKQCIGSVLNQDCDYKIQVIVVNDNSTDETEKIIKSFNDKVVYINLTDGGTAASARNKGLEYATGKYIMFLDSDDILLPNAVKRLVKRAETVNADIVQGGWKYLFDDNSFGPVQNYVDAVYENKLRKDMYDLPGMPWGKIYKRELFDEIRFPSKFTCFEDTIIQFLVFRKAKKISAISNTVYGWRKNNMGITATSQNNFKAIQAYWIAEEMIERNNKLNFEKDEFYYKSVIMQLSNYCYACISGCDDEMQKLVFELCVNLFRKIEKIDTNSFSFAQKLAYKSLVNADFGLWKVQGKLFQLIN